MLQKNISKIIIFPIIIFLFGDVFSFCENIVDSSENTEKSDTTERSSSNLSKMFVGALLFVAAIIIYKYTCYNAYPILKEVVNNEPSSPTPSGGYPETKGNQP